jgi:hypothetical protein
MNHWNKHPMLWGIDESMGVLLAIGLFGSFAISYWPGWRAVGQWLGAPLASLVEGSV